MNMQRFRQVLQYIEARPDEWIQRSTNRCFIGTTVFLCGAVGDWNDWDLARIWLGIGVSPQDWRLFDWISASNRTLDDFRTVARRPFA